METANPEPVSSIIPRAVANIATGNGNGRPDSAVPRTLPDLVRHFERTEAEEYPDVVLDTSKLRMTPDGEVEVPSLRGAFALTEWSRSQLASILGIHWSTYAADAKPEVIADEVNRRLARATGEVRIRSTRTTYDGISADGTVRAVVAPGYSPIADARVARLLSELLAGEEVRVSRLSLGVTNRGILDGGRTSSRSPAAEAHFFFGFWGGRSFRASASRSRKLSPSIAMTSA